MVFIGSSPKLIDDCFAEIWYVAAIRKYIKVSHMPWPSCNKVLQSLINRVKSVFDLISDSSSSSVQSMCSCRQLFQFSEPTCVSNGGRRWKYSQSRNNLNCVVVTWGIGIAFSVASRNLPSKATLKYGEHRVRRSLWTVKTSLSTPTSTLTNSFVMPSLLAVSHCIDERERCTHKKDGGCEAAIVGQLNRRLESTWLKLKLKLYRTVEQRNITL